MSNIQDDKTMKQNVKPTAPLVGKKLGYYEVLEQIGKGGMGVVYKARDKSLDRFVALKVLSPYLSEDPEFEKRFVREARGSAKLDHPNIVQVYAAGKFENTLFIAMQYVKGKTLSQFIKETGKIDVENALSITLQVADALGAAHKTELIHRDIKPNNIMIDEDGNIKVMDFGLSRSVSGKTDVTQTGIYLGTPEYSSPEQCETSTLDNRTDIYSLGVVLYEMLTGRVPHVAETPMALFKKIEKEKPIPIRDLNPSVSQPVVKIVEKMLAKDRNQRYTSCDELKEDILNILDKGQAPALKRWVLISKKSLVAAAIVLFLVGAAIAIAFWGLSEKLKPSDTTRPNTSATADSTKPKPTIDTTRPANTTVPPNVQVPPIKEKIKVIVAGFENKTKSEKLSWHELSMPYAFMWAIEERYKTFIEIVPSEEVLNELGVSNLVAVDKNKARELLKKFNAHFLITGYFADSGTNSDEIEILLNVYDTKTDPIYLTTFERGAKPGESVSEMIDKLVKKLIDKIKEKPPMPIATITTSHHMRSIEEIMFSNIFETSPSDLAYRPSRDGRLQDELAKINEGERMLEKGRHGYSSRDSGAPKQDADKNEGKDFPKDFQPQEPKKGPSNELTESKTTPTIPPINKSKDAEEKKPGAIDNLSKEKEDLEKIKELIEEQKPLKDIKKAKKELARRIGELTQQDQELKDKQNNAQDDNRGFAQKFNLGDGKTQQQEQIVNVNRARTIEYYFIARQYTQKLGLDNESIDIIMTGIKSMLISGNEEGVKSAIGYLKTKSEELEQYAK